MSLLPTVNMGLRISHPKTRRGLGSASPTLMVGLLSAYRRYRVGLDLENPNRQLKVSRLGPRVLSPTEATWLATFESDLQPHHLLTAWVGKEAVLKALGLGVHGVITSVEVLGHERNPVRTDPQSGERQRWSAVWPLVDPSLIVCLATEAAPESIQLIRISASPIT